MKTAAVLLVTMAAVHPFSASADANSGPMELNAASMDSVTAGFSSIMPSTNNLAQQALANVLGESAAPGMSSLRALFGTPSFSQDSGDADNSQNGDRPRTASEEALANALNAFNGSGPSSNATTSPATASPSSSTPVIISVPAAQLEYIRNIAGTGLSVIEPLARGGQNREFVHHLFQNHR